MSSILTQDDKRQTGVYRIRNVKNGRVYVGSAGVSFKERFDDHRRRLVRGRHFNRFLQRDWNKHGEEMFVFEIVERTDPRHAVAQEQVFIDWWKSYTRRSGYNARKTADSPLGMKHSLATRRKVAAAGRGRKHTPETLKKIGDGNRGKVITQDMRERIAAALRGTKASDETRRKQSEAHRARLRDPVARARHGDWSRGKPRSPESVLKGRITMLRKIIAVWEVMTFIQRRRFLYSHGRKTPHQVLAQLQQGALK